MLLQLVEGMKQYSICSCKFKIHKKYTKNINSIIFMVSSYLFINVGFIDIKILYWNFEGIFVEYGHVWNFQLESQSQNLGSSSNSAALHSLNAEDSTRKIAAMSVGHVDIMLMTVKLD